MLFFLFFLFSLCSKMAIPCTISSNQLIHLSYGVLDSHHPLTYLIITTCELLFTVISGQSGFGYRLGLQEKDTIGSGQNQICSPKQKRLKERQITTKRKGPQLKFPECERTQLGSIQTCQGSQISLRHNSNPFFGTTCRGMTCKIIANVALGYSLPFR